MSARYGVLFTMMLQYHDGYCSEAMFNDDPWETVQCVDRKETVFFECDEDTTVDELADFVRDPKWKEFGCCRGKMWWKPIRVVSIEPPNDEKMEEINKTAYKVMDNATYQEISSFI